MSAPPPPVEPAARHRSGARRPDEVEFSPRDVPGVALTYKPTGLSARRGRARRRPRLSPGDRGRRTRLRASPRPHRQAPPRRSTPLLAPGNGSTLAVGSRPRANPRRCRATGGAATRAAASGRSGTLRALFAIVYPRSPPGFGTRRPSAIPAGAPFLTARPCAPRPGAALPPGRAGSERAQSGGPDRRRPDEHPSGPPS